MSGAILRPFDDGYYNHQWNGMAFGVPHASAFDLIDDADQDGDNTYVYTSSPAAFTVELTNCTAGSWPRATRIPSIRIVATVRTTGVLAAAKFRLRILDADYDMEPFGVTSTSYVEVDQIFTLTPYSHAWDVPTINRTEAGLVFTEGDELRCTKLEVHVHKEIIPHYTLQPEGNGHYTAWTSYPAGSPPYMQVSDTFDGDLGYIHNSTINEIHTFDMEDMPGGVLHPPNIDRVSVKALVKNVGTSAQYASAWLRSAGLDFRGGTDTVGVEIPADEKWYLLSDDYLNDPNVAWPSGTPGAAAWLQANINALEAGVENTGGGSFRSTAIALEVFLAYTPSTTINLFPSADGYHQDWSTIVPGAPAWGTVNEDPPDDVASYIILDADTAGTAQYASFTVAGAGAVPAGERILNVEARYRVRLGNLPHSSAWVAPVVRSAGGETYVGKPQYIEGTGGTWFDVKWDFYTDPSTEDPWGFLVEVTNQEWGFVVLSGAMLLSRVRAQVQTVVDIRAVPDPTDLQLTDLAVDPITGYVTRSVAEGLIYAVTEFAVGTGGYVPATPGTIVPVNPADVALAAEVYRAPIEYLEWDATGSPWTVDYFCRVPREVAQYGIGEIGLFATIYWSPVPADIGVTFLFALAHFPCQTRHPDDVQLFVLRVEYP